MSRKTYPGRIDELPSGTLRLRLFLDGESYSYTFPDEDRSEVESFAREEYNRLEAIHRRGRSGARRMSDQLHVFEEDHIPAKAEATQRKYLGAVKGIRRFFVKKQGDPRVRAVNPDDVRAYLAWRRTHGLDGSKLSDPLSKSTLRQQRAVLSAVFSCRGSHNPVPETPEPKPDKREVVLLLGGGAGGAVREAAHEGEEAHEPHAVPLRGPARGGGREALERGPLGQVVGPRPRLRGYRRQRQRRRHGRDADGREQSREGADQERGQPEGAAHRPGKGRAPRPHGDLPHEDLRWEAVALGLPPCDVEPDGRRGRPDRDDARCARGGRRAGRSAEGVAAPGPCAPAGR